MAVIKLSVYFLVATESLNHLMRPNKKIVSNILCAVLVFVFSLFTCENIVSIEIMYRVILTGIPILVLAVFFPIIFVISRKIKRGGESCE